MRSIYKHRHYLLVFLVFGICSCKKLVEVDPPVTSVTGVNVYSSDATAAAVLTGLFTQITPVNSVQASLPMLSVYGGLSADEFTLWSGLPTSGASYLYYTNSLSAITAGYEMWNFLYPKIFVCNSAIAGLNTAAGLTPAVKQQLLGEAEFMRALFYFYLVNLYGDVPLVLNTDYTVSATQARTPKAQVYEQIVTDLKSAQSLLSTNYLDATLLYTTTNKLRPTKWAATALLARVYMYTKDWADAAVQATTLINNKNYSLSPLNGPANVFAANSTEAIWQLQPVNTGWNTELARLFIIPSTGHSSTYYLSLSNSLLNGFEAGDNRKTNWVGNVTTGGVTYYYPYKYKSAILNAPVTEYYMMFRLGEQYLIRAEAEANGVNGGIGAAITDLNVIRTRAGLPGYAGATDQASVLTAIRHERQIELFSENGDRWFDLKRCGTVDAVMTIACPAKGATWNTSQQLYPLPLTDLQKDPNLVQNPGY